MSLIDKSMTLARIAQAHRSGATLPDACRQLGVSVSTMRKWCEEVPALGAVIEDAETDFREELQSALMTPFTHETFKESDVKAATLVSSNLKWVLERADPRRFGNKVEVSTSGADQEIVKALNKAIDRIPLPAAVFPALRIIDGDELDVEKPGRATTLIPPPLPILKT